MGQGQHIHAAYAEPLTLTQLAMMAGMSVPTFHSYNADAANAVCEIGTPAPGTDADGAPTNHRRRRELRRWL